MSNDGRHPTELPDDALQELLGLALRQADPVPEHVLAAARGAFTWRTIDQELADLVFDSATELMGVRDHGGTRQLTFQAPGLEIEVMVADPDARGGWSASLFRHKRQPCAWKAPKVPSSRSPTGSGGSRSTARRPGRCGSPSPGPTTPR